MKIVEGWHCPDLLNGAGKYLERAKEDGIQTVKLARKRRVAIQAGGHVGTWPCFLSHHFETIYTFEPTPDNFDCLIRNIAVHASGPERVFAARGALGDKRGPIDMVMSGKSTGQHRARYPAEKGLGSVPIYRIDDLALPTVDALFLDLEGYEAHALAGALDTLARCRPVVMAENNKRANDQGFKLAYLEGFMSEAGYRVHSRVGEDIIFLPEGAA